jgi:hypothetical protein
LVQINDLIEHGLHLKVFGVLEIGQEGCAHERALIRFARAIFPQDGIGYDQTGAACDDQGKTEGPARVFD